MCLECSYDAHDARADVDVLKWLVDMKIPTLLLLKHSCSLQSAWVVTLLSEKEKKSAEELKAKIPKACLSASMATKIVHAGLTYSDLELAAERKGEEGLRLLLQERTPTGKARITSSSKVVGGLAKHFCPSQEFRTPLAEITEEKLALFMKRKEEGYDIPDKEYHQWLDSQN